MFHLASRSSPSTCAGSQFTKDEGSLGTSPEFFLCAALSQYSASQILLFNLHKFQAMSLQFTETTGLHWIHLPELGNCSSRKTRPIGGRTSYVSLHSGVAGPRGLSTNVCGQLSHRLCPAFKLFTAGRFHPDPRTPAWSSQEAPSIELLEVGLVLVLNLWGEFYRDPLPKGISNIFFSLHSNVVVFLF